MAKTNYSQLKRQKEAARKARQDARLARKRTRAADSPAPEDGAGDPAPAGRALPGL